MTLNICQAGHTFHESKLVDTEYGPWWIWDWERYAGFAGYCTGQDEVSKSIEITGWWEKADTDQMLAILRENPGGRVMDWGSHIGWFSILAALEDFQVYSIDADPENMRLLQANAELRGVDWLDPWEPQAGIVPRIAWAKDVLSYEWNFMNWRFMKVDIESREIDAVESTRMLWESRMIDYALLEVSPIFEDRENMMAPSYAELVDELIGYGYRATVYKSEGPWEITGKDCTFDQENVLFSKL